MPSRVENTIMENYASVVLVNLRRVMREPYYDHKCIPELFGFFILCGLQLSFPLFVLLYSASKTYLKLREKKKMRAWIIKIKIIVVHELSVVNHWAVGWLAGSDVIPIRKPWNNGVGVTFQQPVCHEEDDVLMVSEYTRAPSSSVNWPCHLSSSKTCQLFFLHFWPYMQCRTSRLLSGLCFPKKIPRDGQKWKYECVFPQTCPLVVLFLLTRKFFKHHFITPQHMN